MLKDCSNSSVSVMHINLPQTQAFLRRTDTEADGAFPVHMNQIPPPELRDKLGGAYVQVHDPAGRG